MKTAATTAFDVRTTDDAVALQAPGDAEPTVYRFGPGEPKPCVHPLHSPKGHRLSGYQMSDHVWHRALWFTIKYLNKHNFWEENEADFGVQVSQAPPEVDQLDAGAVRLTHDIAWTSQTTGKTFDEVRTLTFRALDDGTRSIDWETRLTAAQDLELDRTVYTTWGGYGGLSFRASRELHNAKLQPPSGEPTDNIAGVPHEWVLMQGQMDGGTDEFVSIGLIDHPSNPRATVPIYAKTAQVGNSFMNAAFLFHEPMRVKQAEVLSFRYRVPYRDGKWTREQFAKLAAAFRAEA